MDDNKSSTARVRRRPPPPNKNAAFRPGKSGACEAQLWEFSAPSISFDETEQLVIERVAAGSLDEALQYLRRRHPDFVVAKAEAAGLVTLVSGSPLD